MYTLRKFWYFCWKAVIILLIFRKTFIIQDINYSIMLINNFYTCKATANLIVLINVCHFHRKYAIACVVPIYLFSIIFDCRWFRSIKWGFRRIIFNYECILFHFSYLVYYIGRIRETIFICGPYDHIIDPCVFWNYKHILVRCIGTVKFFNYAVTIT